MEGHSDLRLVEPFCGGLAVTLGLNPDRALISDINPHLINLYRWVQRGLTVSIPLKNDEAVYYQHRTRFNELVMSDHAESKEAAELFYYLNRTGFNGCAGLIKKVSLMYLLVGINGSTMPVIS